MSSSLTMDKIASAVEDKDKMAELGFICKYSGGGMVLYYQDELIVAYYPFSAKGKYFVTFPKANAEVLS